MATNTVELSVVVPVYNNADTLDELIDRLIAILDPMAMPFELIFVDDGSRDTSLRVLERRAERDPRIRPSALVRNFGSQSAACAGFDLVRGRWVAMLDADLENCPEDIPTLLAPLRDGYDLVCGYRENRDAPWLTRRLPSRLMNAYVNRQTGTHLHDVGCGMRACEAWVVKGLETEGEARRLLTPLFLRRARRVTEVALRPAPKRTPPGHSFFTLLAIALDYYMLTARRPFLVSGTLSLVAAVIGAAMLLFGPRLPGLVVAASGLLGGLLSLVGEYCQRLYQLGQGVPFYELRDRDAERARAEAAEREAAQRAAGR
jgi:glycosyltransferase involved in cell wall biosynthesis